MASEDCSFRKFLEAPSPCNLRTTDDPHHVVSFYAVVPPCPNAKQNLGRLEDSDDDHLDFQFNIGSGVGEGFITASSFEESPKEKRGLRRCAESMPSVSFADELFCDGKVKAALPPPPGCRSPVASPKSPLSRRNSLWNDDFDPFVAALESVKEDNHRRNTKKNHRRARSVLPLDVASHRHQLEEEQLGIVVPKSPVQERLGEPKGVDFSRRLRQVKSLANNGDSGRKTKKQKMMRFLTLRSKSLEKEEDSSHGRNPRMNSLMRKLSFNRSSIETETKNKKKKMVAMAASTACATRNGSRAVTKVSVMQYRPRLLLCLGYGMRRSSYR